MEEICNNHLNIIQNNYNQIMKITYKTPDCELVKLRSEGVLCYSGEGGIPNLSTDTFDEGNDFETIY